MLLSARVWDGQSGANVNWQTAANWVGDVAPQPGDELIFPTGVTALDTNNDFPAGTAFGLILIEGLGYTLGCNGILLENGIEFQGGNTTLNLPLTLGASQTIVAPAGLTINGNINQNGYALAFENNSTTGGTWLTVNGAITGDETQLIFDGSGYGNATVNGSISGAGGVLVEMQDFPEDTVTFSGVNTYNGATTISGGTLNINADAALGTAPASPATNVTFSGNGTLEVGAASVCLSGNRNIVIDSGVTVTIDTQGNTMIIPGVISGGGNLTMTGGGALSLSSPSYANGSEGIDTLTINSGSVSVGDVANVAFAGNIVNNSNLYLNGDNPDTAFNITGTGTIYLEVPCDVVLGGGSIASTQSWVIGPGRVFFANQAYLGGGPVTLNANGTLDYQWNSAALTLANAVTMNSGGNLATRNGAMTADNVTLPTSGTVFFNRDDCPTTSLTIGGANATTLAAGNSLTIEVGSSYGGVNGQGSTGAVTISKPFAGGGGLVKAGYGMNGAATTLVLSGTNTYTGTTTVDSGTLALGNPLALQDSTLDTSGGGAVSFGSLTAATLGGLQGSNALALQDSSAAAVALTVGNNNSSTTFSGSLTGGGSLTKNGSGKLTLSNTNTYTGATTVNAGTLAVDGAPDRQPRHGQHRRRVGGRQRHEWRQPYGHHLPADRHSLRRGTGGGERGQYDQLNVTGTAILSGATLNVSYLNNFLPAVNQSFTIIHTTGGVSGQFAEGSTVTVGNATYTVTYGANGGKDVVLTATSYNITPVTTTVSTSQASVVYGTPVSFTATVSAQSGSAAPAGSVDFVDTTAGIALGNGTFGSTSGLASTWTYTTGVKTFNVTAGDIITATYTPGMGFTGSSGTTTQTITATSHHGHRGRQHQALRWHDLGGGRADDYFGEPCRRRHGGLHGDLRHQERGHGQDAHGGRLGRRRQRRRQLRGDLCAQHRRRDHGAGADLGWRRRRHPHALERCEQLASRCGARLGQRPRYADLQHLLYKHFHQPKQYLGSVAGEHPDYRRRCCRGR